MGLRDGYFRSDGAERSLRIRRVHRSALGQGELIPSSVRRL
ncbi:hypothetical protein [Rhodococcus sp. OK302]|nr:hypothetical protein [Rhodococcus sp. OK302]